MTDIRFADVSEFQSNIDADAYIRGGHRVIICRVHNGYRPDRFMPTRATYLRAQPFTAIGWYQYVVKDRDPGLQAHEFASVVGQLRANEFPIGDFEEGTGNQTSRAEAWMRVVDGWAKFPSTLYSGDAFIRAQLGGISHWVGKRPVWIASYPVSYAPVPSMEPAGATFWQFSDREKFPGIAGGVDASIYHGTAQQFLERVRPVAAAPPKPKPREESITLALPGGRIETIVERASGEVFRRHQTAPGNGWSGWTSLGKP